MAARAEPSRVALVTGSSRGLGSAIARRLARDGLAVAVNGFEGGADAERVADAFVASTADAASAEPISPG